MMKLIVLAAFVAVASSASIKSVAPFIEGTADCGSTGNVIRMHVSGCTHVPCEFVAGTVVNTEIDFAPAEGHLKCVSWIQVIVAGIPIDIHKEDIPNSGVEEGKAYTVANTIPIDLTLKGVTLIVQVGVIGSDKDKGPLIVCKRAQASIA